MQDTTTPSLTLPPTQPRRLVRTPDRKLAGVASGIGHYLGVDPTIVRIGFLVLTAAGGIGLLLYGICWLVMPAGQASTHAATSPLDTWAILGVVGLVAGIALLFGWHGIGDGSRAVAAAALLVGGVLLVGRFRGNDGPPGGSSGESGPQPATPTPPAPTPAPAPAADAPDAETAEITDVLPETEHGTAAAASAAPAVRSKGLTAGVLSLAAIAIAAGVAALLAEVGGDLEAADVIAASVVIVGLGLLVSAFVARAIGLVVVGTMLTGALLVVSGIQPILDDGAGERLYRPLAAEQLLPEYRLGAGDLEVDLSRLRLVDGERHEVHVKLGFGQATVIVPDEVDVEVHGSVTGGSVDGFGRFSEDIFEDDFSFAATGTDQTAGTLVIDLDIGFGEGVVRHG